MRSLMLCACVLIISFQSSSSIKLKQLRNEPGNIQDDFDACLNEYDVSRKDIYKQEEIMANVHVEPANKERTRKNGCFIVCMLKDMNLIEGTIIKETQVHTKINEMFGDSIQGVAHKIARKCMKKARNITQECEKCSTLFLCVIKSIHKLERTEKQKEKQKKKYKKINIRTVT